MIENVKLVDVYIKLSNGNNAGALAGINAGTIRHASASGRIDVVGSVIINVGGLVGQNTARIINSISEVDTSAGGTDSKNVNVGGLAGDNNGEIKNSFAFNASVTSNGSNNIYGRIAGNLIRFKPPGTLKPGGHFFINKNKNDYCCLSVDGDKKDMKKDCINL